jgi:GT2 family glycosyltransferase
VIVVDNASTDGSAELVADQFPSVRLIRHQENLGFAGACNAGLRVAEGEVLVLLNQDTRVHEGWLAALVRHCREPSAGVVGCKALYPDGETIQHAGGRVEWPSGAGIHDGRGERDRGQYDEPRSVDYVTGAAMAFRREVLDEVGLLDEGFWPGYFEDTDYCARVREAGYQVRYAPDAVLIHDESPSLGQTEALSIAYHRGRLRFVLKHLPPQRLLGEFVPSERAELGDVQREVYLQTIPVAAAIVPRRWKADADLVGRVLSALEELYLAPAPDLAPEEVGPALTDYAPRSSVPVLGPLIAGLRSLWYGVATRWAVRHLAQQQAAINRQYRARIAQLEDGHRQTVRSLVALSRELACVVQELERGRDGDE